MGIVRGRGEEEEDRRARGKKVGAVGWWGGGGWGVVVVARGQAADTLWEATCKGTVMPLVAVSANRCLLGWGPCLS